MQEQIKRKQAKQDYEAKKVHELAIKHAQRRQKIIVVANRLPSTPKKDSEGVWTFSKCSGGLVSCLAGIQNRFDMVWLGWPGCEIAPEDRDTVSMLLTEQNCYPAYLPSDLIDEYYNGFSSNVLWPLFHYVMPPFFDKGVNDSTVGQFDAYKKANEIFTEAILQVYEDDDYVWIHDYHLMLVPKMLRDKKHDCNIGWFCHTPFPSAEIYRTLPWRQEIIESLLHANLLGFHVYDYLRHFLNACQQLTSLLNSAHSVDATSIGGCIVNCATVPVGISPQDFLDALETPEVQQSIEKLRMQYGHKRVILGIDRLDYTKGIPHKLTAFGCFLDKHPDWATRCVLVQLAVPSRRDVPEYQRLMRQVHELVGQVCGRHSSLESGAPVIYLDQSMSFHDLVALYQFADVGLITSLRDGMNLVSYEFVACHHGKETPGVLILSEFAGAAQSLGAGCIRVNPWNVKETADAIYDALEMSREDRLALHNYSFKYISQHTATKWAETFLQSLQDSCSEFSAIAAEVQHLPKLRKEELLRHWSDSTRRRLIVLDLLDCLVTVKKGSRRQRMQLSTELTGCLKTLANCPNTTVVLTTDKPRNVMETICWGVPVLQAAEGCTVYRRPERIGDGSTWSWPTWPDGSTRWTQLVEEDVVSHIDQWRAGVEGVFDYFKDRTPGSYSEKQEFQSRWCWDNVQLNHGAAQAREVLIHLWSGPLVNSEAEVVVGEKWITVRPHSCSRRDCLERLLNAELGKELQNLDFVLCFAVVSHRDEDVFDWCRTLTEDTQMDDDSEQPFTDESEGSQTSGDVPCRATSSGPMPSRTPRPTGSRDFQPLPCKGFCTPREPPLEVQPGGRPPPAPAAELEGPSSSATKPVEDEPAPSPLHHERDVHCYTLTLGMGRTKAKHSLPDPYDVQNLIRAMASRVSRPPNLATKPDG